MLPKVSPPRSTLTRRSARSTSGYLDKLESTEPEERSTVAACRQAGCRAPPCRPGPPGGLRSMVRSLAGSRSPNFKDCTPVRGCDRVEYLYTTSSSILAPEIFDKRRIPLLDAIVADLPFRDPQEPATRGSNPLSDSKSLQKQCARVPITAPKYRCPGADCRGVAILRRMDPVRSQLLPPMGSGDSRPTQSSRREQQQQSRGRGSSPTLQSRARSDRTSMANCIISLSDEGGEYRQNFESHLGGCTYAIAQSKPTACGTAPVCLLASQNHSTG